MPSMRLPLEPIMIGVWRAGFGQQDDVVGAVVGAVERHPLAARAAR